MSKRRWFHISVITSLTLALVVGCAPPTSTWDELAADTPIVTFDHYQAGFERTKPPAGDDYLVETNSDFIRVSTLSQSDTLPEEIAAEAAELLGYSDANIAESGLQANEGELFYAVSFSFRANYWPTLDSEDYFMDSYRFVLGDKPPIILEEANQHQWHLFAAPEDAAPEDYVFEVETDGIVQSLSLIDGSRVHSDVERIYGRYEVVSMDNVHDHELYAITTNDHGETDRVWVRGFGNVIAPMIPGLGWAEAGHIYLGFQFVPVQSMSRPNAADSEYEFEDGTTYEVHLGDGSVIPAEQITSDISPYSESVSIAWFQIPVDTQRVTVVINVEPYPRRDGLAEDLGDLVFTQPVDFSME